MHIAAYNCEFLLCPFCWKAFCSVNFSEMDESQANICSDDSGSIDMRDLGVVASQLMLFNNSTTLIV